MLRHFESIAMDEPLGGHCRQGPCRRLQVAQRVPHQIHAVALEPLVKTARSKTALGGLVFARLPWRVREHVGNARSYGIRYAGIIGLESHGGPKLPLVHDSSGPHVVAHFFPKPRDVGHGRA